MTKRGHHKPANSNAPQLSARPVWQGQLRLSLVSCPVALYGATTRASDISFHLLNPDTNNRIRMIPTDPDTGPVERADLVKGYEISKNKYVVLSNEELDAVRLETTHTIEIERFVEREGYRPPLLERSLLSGAERRQWRGSLYRDPRGAVRSRAHRAGPRGDAYAGAAGGAGAARSSGIMVYTLRMADEVISPKEVFADIPAARPDKEMIEIARKIIEQREGDFEPSKFEDRYENALRDLIRRKQKGEKLVTAEPVEEDNVIDLMAALKKSLKQKNGRRRAS